MTGGDASRDHSARWLPVGGSPACGRPAAQRIFHYLSAAMDAMAGR
jgi:hypothetical protein